MTYKIDHGKKIAKSKLIPNTWNPNKLKPRVEEALTESITQYGQIADILVRPHPSIVGSYEIIDGEHRFNNLPEQVYCTIIHDIPDADAKKLTIILNETHGQADKIDLIHLLASLESEIGMEQLFLGLPYSPSELDELVKMAEFDWDSFSQLSPQSDALRQDTTTSVSTSGDRGKTDSDTEITDDDIPTDGVGLKPFRALVTPEVYELLNDAMGQVKHAHSVSLDSNPDVAWGQALEIIVLNFLND